MSRSSWDRESLSLRALAFVVVLVVVSVLFVPAGWQSLRPGAGTAEAQVTDNPPPETEGGVSEFLEAAKLGALASGNVIAGPGQVVFPAGSSGTAARRERLWDTVGDAKQVTLTLQGVGGCEISFEIQRRARDRALPGVLLTIGPSHESTALTASDAFVIRYHLLGKIDSECLFLWVLRETGVTVSRPR